MKHIIFAFCIFCISISCLAQSSADTYFQRGDYVNALALYKQMAANGNAIACSNAAYQYEEGLGTQKDYYQASVYYKKAISINPDTTDMLSLANLYGTGGFNLKQDYFQAMEYYKKAANYGVRWANVLIGLWYQQGKGTMADASKAVEYFKKASQYNQDWADFYLACCYRDGEGVNKDNNEAEYYFKREALRSNNADAWFELGCLYYHGIPGTINKKDTDISFNFQKAIECFEKSLPEKPMAYAMLATAYRDGGPWIAGKEIFEMQQKNINEAKADYYFKLADKANVLENYDYSEWAELYHLGNGVKKDLAKAISIYKMSAAKGWFDAYNYIAQCYLEGGYGIEKNVQTAISYYQKGIAAGCTMSAFYLGNLYSDGEYVKKDYLKAETYYLKSCELEEKDKTSFYWKSHLADVRLGQIYEEGGHGLTRNLEKAYKYYKIGADGGTTDCKMALARWYENGIFVGQNYKTAFDWYKKAGSSYDEARFYGMGLGQPKNLEKAFEIIDECVEKYPSSKTKYLSLKGLLLLEEKKVEEAMTIWDQIKSDDSYDKSKNNFASLMTEMEKNSVDQFDYKAPSTNSSTYVAIIANENYKREENVVFASNDGMIFEKYCSNVLGIPNQNIKFIEDATGNEIKFALNWLSQCVTINGPETKIIFYYAGHGMPDEKTQISYLLPVDGFGSDVSTGFCLNDVYDKLGEISAKSSLVLLDACFSGAKRNGGMLLTSRGVAIKAKQKEPSGNTIVLSAAQADETALPYAAQKHGLFTYALLKRLKETNGNVSLGDLCDYIQKEVQKLSVQENGKLQTPTYISSPAIRNEWKNWKL